MWRWFFCHLNKNKTKYSNTTTTASSSHKQPAALLISRSTDGSFAVTLCTWWMELKLKLELSKSAGKHNDDMTVKALLLAVLLSAELLYY
jgi:hypothetical protein